MKKVLLYLFVILQVVCIAQTSQLDSLKLAFKKAKHDTTRIQIYLSWGVQIYLQQPDSALVLWEKASNIAKYNLEKRPQEQIQSTLIKKYLAESLNNIGNIYFNQGDITKALDYWVKSLKIQEGIADKQGIATTLNNIGAIYKRQGNIPKVLEYYHKSLKLLEEIGDKQGIAESLNNIGVVYNNQGDITKALECFGRSLKIQEEIGDKQGVALSLNNIGNIYENQGDILQALEYYEKSLKMYNEFGDKLGVAHALNNIGGIHIKQKNFPKAMEYYSKCLKIQEQIGDNDGAAFSLNNIGGIYLKQQNLSMALEYYKKSLIIREAIRDKQGIAYALNNIGGIYIKQKNYPKAIEFCSQSQKISREIGYPQNIRNASEQLYQIYKATGNHKLALENYELYIQMRDSLNNIETQKATIKQQTQYEYDKKKAIADKEHELQLKQQEEKSAAEKAKQNIIIASVSLVLLLVAVFSGFLYNRFKVTQKQKAIIEQKEKETQQQKHIIEEKHKEITDSINYAERIQRSFLATQSHLEGNLNPSLRGVPIAIGTTKQSVDEIASPPAGVRNDDSNYFILFKPKDVVSGDFYWSATLNNGHFALATADSTGHGVPGAIMSLLNITSLEKAIETETSPDKILNLTRNIIIERLKKDGSIDGGKDGMDCSLIVFNENRTRLQIAAANNPVWIMRSSSLREVPTPKGIGTTKQSGVSNEEIASLTTYARNDVEVMEIKPDKMPVGKHDKQDVPFTLQELELQAGDVIYTLTDGFPDQFGGERGKKFMAKKLRELLQSICHLPMPQQQEILFKTFSDWVGDLEQVDDVTLIGIRV